MNRVFLLHCASSTILLKLREIRGVMNCTYLLWSCIYFQVLEINCFRFSKKLKLNIMNTKEKFLILLIISRNRGILEFEMGKSILDLSCSRILIFHETFDWNFLQKDKSLGAFLLSYNLWKNEEMCLQIYKYVYMSWQAPARMSLFLSMIFGTFWHSSSSVNIVLATSTGIGLIYTWVSFGNITT